MPTNQQRREAERRRLQRQLEERRAREAARKQMTLIGSIIGTLLVIALIVVIVVVSTGSDKKKNNAGGNKDTITSSPSPTTSATTTAPAITTPTKPCEPAPKTSMATFQGVTVGRATDLKHAPTVKSLSQKAPTTVQCQDLVVGKGKPASSSSTVTVQYTGVLYKNGTQFDSSWKNGQPVQFSLAPGPQGVILGFSQGIGGAGNVAPMREGGRRIMVLPAALAYGSTPNGSIPANSPLVFVVDLKSVDG